MNRDIENCKILEKRDEYTVYEVMGECNKKRIYGKVFLPNDNKEIYPLVISSHGLGSSIKHTSKNADFYAKHSIACYVYDFCGGSPRSLSDGDVSDMSVLTEIAETQSVLELMKSFSFVDKEKIFLMGESQGGLVSAIVASRNRDDVRGLILFFPAFNIPDDLHLTYPEYEMIQDTTEKLGCTLSRKFYEDVYYMDTYEQSKNFNKNVLIIHGTADDIVPISYSLMAAVMYENVSLVMIEGAGHCFYGDDLTRAITEAVSFVNGIV